MRAQLREREEGSSRYEPVENVALKMEVVLGQEDRSDGSEADVVVWAFQLSWWL